MGGFLNLEVSEGYSGLKVSNLRKSYNSRLVLRDISLTLHQREIVALLGANGTGKTTCFYSIAGLTSIDSGTITLNGKNISGMPIYKRANLGLSYLPQEPSIFKGMTVEDNVASVLEISTRDRFVRRIKLESLLTSFSLTNIRKAKAITLSGGERRRVEIARNLATYPKYLLLDEPMWRDLNDCWDLTAFVEIDLKLLKRRLIKRWIAQGFNDQEAEAWIETNDLPNAHRILQNRIPEDVTLSMRS